MRPPQQIEVVRGVSFAIMLALLIALPLALLVLLFSPLGGLAALALLVLAGAIEWLAELLELPS